MNRTERKRKLENNNFFFFSILCKIYGEEICKIMIIKEKKMKYKKNEKFHRIIVSNTGVNL
jgi:hypothetical protein